MVFTRNQKRSLEVEEDYTNVQLTKRKTEESDGTGVDNQEEVKEQEDISTIETITSDATYIQESEDSEETESCFDEMSVDVEEDVEEEIEADDLEEDLEEEEHEGNINKKLTAQQLLEQFIKKGKQARLKGYKEKEPKNVYNAFFKIVDSIYDGSFFERIPLEEKRKWVKENYTEEAMNSLVAELKEIQKKYKETTPSIIDIVKMNVSPEQKQKLLEKMHHFINSDLLGPDYNQSLKYLTSSLPNNEQEKRLFELEQEIIKFSNNSGDFSSYKNKILTSNMPFENKVIAYKKLEIMETYEESDTSEYAKYKNWMDSLLSIPFGKYIDPGVLIDSDKEVVSNYIKTIRNTLNNRLSFLEKPKDQIINIVAQSIRNPDAGINSIGLFGSKGLGKTSIVKSISEALGRPYRTISLGGESDSSVLTGHGFTYVGSMPGRIIEILRETKCMNPIILIDELDKISQTHQGKEIVGTLIHLTDTTTNGKYTYDKYFSGIEFDLSKVMFIFTYNDPSKVDKILADRLFKIKVENYTTKEKLEITQQHIIKNVLSQFNFSETEINFSNESIDYIVNGSSSDEGMRDIKRKIEIIVSRINTLLLTKKEDNIVDLKYKELYDYYHQLPITVQKQHVDTFLHQSISNNDSSSPPPFGMYI